MGDKYYKFIKNLHGFILLRCIHKNICALFHSFVTKSHWKPSKISRRIFLEEEQYFIHTLKTGGTHRKYMLYCHEMCLIIQRYQVLFETILFEIYETSGIDDTPNLISILKLI